MNPGKMEGLLADILNAQIEDEPPDMSPDIWRQAILGQRKLNTAEERVLWTSPSARDEFLRLRRVLLAPARDAWRAQGLDANVFLMAAASEDREHLVEGKGWQLSIAPIPTAGWVLTLRVEPQSAALLPEYSRVRLVDDDGLIWGQGRLDDDGALDLDWPHDGSPLERLRRMGLRLQVV